MSDKKIIKGLEECVGNGNCMKCQYGKEKQALSCKKLLTDALALLKEQKAKTGEWIPVTNGRGGMECSICHDYAPSYQNGTEYLSKYCPNCGVKMKGR